jgi:hypothetical protein
LNALATALLVASALSALKSSYRFLEWSHTILVLVFLAVVAVAFLSVQPGLTTILRHLLVPSLPVYPEWAAARYPGIVSRGSWVEVMTYLGFIGGSGSDYVGYLSFARDKRWGRAGPAGGTAGGLDGWAPTSGEEAPQGKLWLRAPLVDVCLSFGCVVVFTTMFLVLGAAILAPQEVVPNEAEILSVQASFLTRLHPALFPLYALGVSVVFLGTLYGTFEIQSRAIDECLLALRSHRTPAAFRSLRQKLVLGGMAVGIAFIWIDWSPLMVLTPASILSGVFACGLYALAMARVESRCMPAELKLGILPRAILLMGGLVMTLLGLRALYDYVLLLLR